MEGVETNLQEQLAAQQQAPQQLQSVFQTQQARERVRCKLSWQTRQISRIGTQQRQN